MIIIYQNQREPSAHDSQPVGTSRRQTRNVVNNLRTTLTAGLYALLLWLYLAVYAVLVQLMTNNWIVELGLMFIIALGAIVMFAIGLAIGRYTPISERRPIPFRAWAPLMCAMLFIGSTQLAPRVDEAGFAPILLYFLWLIPLFVLIYRSTRVNRSIGCK